MLSRANLFRSVGALEGVDMHRIVVATLASFIVTISPPLYGSRCSGASPGRVNVLRAECFIPFVKNALFPGRI